MPRRDFVLAETETNADPPVFSLAGQEFKCVPDPPGGALSDLFWAAQGNITTRAAGFVRFISACLPAGDEEAFDLLIHDKDVIVDLFTLSEIGNWLVEAYTSRPTTPSSGLPDGSSATSATSEGGAGSQASASADSGSSS